MQNYFILIDYEDIQDKNLNNNTLIIYSFIKHYKNDFTLTNEQMSKLLNIPLRTIARTIDYLIKIMYIKSHIKQKGFIKKRTIEILTKPAILERQRKAQEAIEAFKELYGTNKN